MLLCGGGIALFRFAARSRLLEAACWLGLGFLVVYPK